ncbi:hypothetical protein ARTHRO8AJ_380021 [Arthrobacter sp. 8AJ]|nr:hypothetical protein ARTHRO8AJ_380021 [Arthrobacter sp. 8AJ]
MGMAVAVLPMLVLGRDGNGRPTLAR